ncbi:MAG: glucokinase [Alphaproteobacteria bacterium]|nr:glucokinase [Alphaproteobacteria bacterium]|tara:strand:+ start:2398 stop:3372 length:975 start_codon:yes stop_codon:yes gene_type:complete
MNAKKYGLVADIGATNARFAIADESGVHEAITLQCVDHENLVDAAEHYMQMISANTNTPSAGMIAIAGPVQGDVFEMTNHAWRFSIKDTQSKLKFDHFRVMNDFEAIAYAVPSMDKEYIEQIGGAAPRPQGTIAVVGPGTGLGVAGLVWGGDDYIVNPGEGGHVTMPARSFREYELIDQLHYKYRHISAERVCSGKGLVNLYQAIRSFDEISIQDAPDLSPEEIATKALNNECKICVEALDLMYGFLGTIAGNLALTYGAHGGVYIAGGITTKLGDYIHKSRFRDEFVRKGRFENYLAEIPAFLITHDNIAFVGLQDQLLKALK